MKGKTKKSPAVKSGKATRKSATKSTATSVSEIASVTEGVGGSVPEAAIVTEGVGGSVPEAAIASETASVIDGAGGSVPEAAIASETASVIDGAGGSVLEAASDTEDSTTEDDPGGKLISKTIKDMATKLELRHNVTAGIDVHKETLVVCVQWPDKEETRSFRNLKCDSRKLARWLIGCGVEVALMESTGIYWKSPHDILRNHGVVVHVVNARHIKRFEGHKTDKMDASGLATLAKLGIMRPSRVPESLIDELRSMCRLREASVKSETDWKNRTLKLLTAAGFGVSQVATDAFGASGRLVIDGLLDGLGPEAILAKLEEDIGYRLQASQETLLDAIEGEMSEAVKLQVRLALEACDYHEAMAARFEAEIKERLSLAGYEPELMLLQTLPGVSEVAAMTLLLELGCDVTDFESASRLSSWAGMAPGNNESAGKRKSGRTTGGNRHLKRILCEIANSASRTKCYFKAKYQSLRSRRGHNRAIVAIGHKILRVVYCMLTRTEVYEDRLEDFMLENGRRYKSRWQKKIDEYNKLRAKVARIAARTAA
jgi:transposase